MFFFLIWLTNIWSIENRSSHNDICNIIYVHIYIYICIGMYTVCFGPPDSQNASMHTAPPVWSGLGEHWPSYAPSILPGSIVKPGFS